MDIYNYILYSTTQTKLAYEMLKERSQPSKAAYCIIQVYNAQKQAELSYVVRSQETGYSGGEL